MRKVIYLFIATVLLSCAGEEKQLPKNFDFGETGNGSYTNDYFDMEVSFDPNWVVQNQQEMNNLVERGSDIITGDDENLKSMLKASQVNTAYLLAVFKHEVGAAVEYNPSLMLIAENTKNFPGIRTGKDYLFHARSALEQTQMAYSFEKEVFERTIGDTPFHVMETNLDFMGKTITQEYISTVNRGFSLSFVISYTTEEEKNELHDIINKVKI